MAISILNLERLILKFKSQNMKEQENNMGMIQALRH